jgi:aminomethyltransferase
MESSSKTSPLHHLHQSRGARLIDFAGWKMPLQFQGILQEHHAVRQSAGLFDISHMGQITVEGPEAETFLNRLLSNDTRKLAPGTGQYTLLLNTRGGILDDLLCYRLNEESFFLVPNASQTDADFAWLQAETRGANVRIENQSALWGALALQGPHSSSILQALLGPGTPLPARNRIASLPLANGPVLVARTGYTGEDGFEWFCPASTLPLWWEALLHAGEPLGLLPCGLGARDTLRLEAGLPLHGADLSTEHTPLEAGLSSFVSLEKNDFIGKSALLAQKDKGIPTRLVGLRLQGKTPPPRAHYPVWAGDRAIGETTSGCLSPTLGMGIALAYLPPEHSTQGTTVDIEIRGQRFPATVANKRALPHPY